MRVSSMILAAAVAVLAASSVEAQTKSPTHNPAAAPAIAQQQICAKPTKGCGSQKRDTSCTNWHGCMWQNNVCMDDPSCDNGKPTHVPTVFVPPTPPTTARPTTKAPTPKATKCTQVPPSGMCFDAKTATECGTYGCCLWNAPRNLCQYNEPPTKAPTTAKPTMATAAPTTPQCAQYKKSKRACAAHGCKWCGNCPPARRCTLA